MKQRKQIKADYWSRTQTMALIDLWRECPTIYNKFDPFYTIKMKRDEKFEYILKHLKQHFNGNLTVLGIKTKMRTLYSQLSKERGRVISYQRAGGDVCTYKPTLWCYDQMQFLATSDIRNYSTQDESNTESNDIWESYYSDRLDEDIQDMEEITETQDDSDYTTEELVIECLSPEEDQTEYQYAPIEEPRSSSTDYNSELLRRTPIKTAMLIDKNIGPSMTRTNRDNLEAKWCEKKYKLEMELIRIEHEERMKILKSERKSREARRMQALEKHNLEMDILRIELEFKSFDKK